MSSLTPSRQIKKRLLLIEDEEEIATLIKLHAEKWGYLISVASEGVSGYKTLLQTKPDLLLIDITLPDQHGFDLCKKIKLSENLRSIPLIFLSPHAEETDMLLGLEMGADDYVIKPFSLPILFSRIKAVLRRSKTARKPQKNLRFHNFTLDLERYLLKKANTIIPVTFSEFEILKRLLLKRGKPLSRNELLEGLCEEELVIDRNIDVHIASLRKKLGPQFDLIETVRGIGYRFKESLLPLANPPEHRYTRTTSNVGFSQGVALNLVQAKPTSKQLNSNELGDAEGPKFSG